MSIELNMHWRCVAAALSLLCFELGSRSGATILFLRLSFIATLLHLQAY